ncbi:MAG TPA: CDP-alcohol phosphatidyltransferase family protein [Candidatus Limnocylindria bacterium]|jgi:CDP-diacylglycerol---glycerol-3-phosphate 3-phosphatidyltransferase|nr:CDP-alcohol phosphatidyltransferase family protein [Candidatus Limnocylindria bacterium]
MSGSLVSADLRERVRAGIEPLARGLGRLGLTPNVLTLIGFGIAIVAGYFAATQAWLVAGLLVAFGAVFDLFDGAVARATGTTSRFGAFMDSTFDRAGEAVVYLGIAWGLGARDIEGGVVGGQVLAMLALAASFMVSYVRAKSESLGFTPGTGMANVGLAPREVRMMLVVIGLVLTGLVGGIGAEFFPNPAGQLALFGSLTLITVLATVTTIQRIYFVYRQSTSDKENQ